MSKIEICPICKADPKIICPRDVDAKCLICGRSFCGGHIGKHLKVVHCVSLDLDHCSAAELVNKYGGRKPKEGRR